jgi:hypothetical protein
MTALVQLWSQATLLRRIANDLHATGAPLGGTAEDGCRPWLSLLRDLTAGGRTPAIRPFPLPVASFWITVSHDTEYTDMKRHAAVYCLLITIVVILAVPGVFAQAAAESALINSMSSTSTANAGTALGRALNQATGNVQQHTSTVLQGAGVRNSPNTHVNRPVTITTSRMQPLAGGLGISVRGGQLRCEPISPAVQTSDPKSAQPIQTNCGNQSATPHAAGGATQKKDINPSSASPSPK